MNYKDIMNISIIKVINKTVAMAPFYPVATARELNRWWHFKTPYNSHMGKQIENERLLLGRRIRSLRNIKGWTQEELGRQADLSYKFIGEIERGQQNSSFDTLVKIAIALKVEILELFRYEQETVDITAIENRIGRIMKTLPDEDMRRLLMVLRVLYPAT